jgi:cell division transport system permease protein
MTLGQNGWIVIIALPFAFVGFAATVAYVAVVRALGRVA